MHELSAGLAVFAQRDRRITVAADVRTQDATTQAQPHRGSAPCTPALHNAWQGFDAAHAAYCVVAFPSGDWPPLLLSHPATAFGLRPVGSTDTLMRRTPPTTPESCDPPHPSAHRRHATNSGHSRQMHMAASTWPGSDDVNSSGSLVHAALDNRGVPANILDNRRTVASGSGLIAVFGAVIRTDTQNRHQTGSRGNAARWRDST
jgi:hypothetical protein